MIMPFSNYLHRHQCACLSTIRGISLKVIALIEKAYVHPESDAHIHMQIFRTNISSLALMSAVPPDLPLHNLRIFKASHPSPSQPPCSWPLCVSCSYGSPTRHKTRIPLWAMSFSLRLVKCYSHTFTPPDFHHHRLSVGDNLCYFSSSLPSIWRQQISDATLLYSSSSSSVNYICIFSTIIPQPQRQTA